MNRIDIYCPHAKSDMTPCVARDGETAVTTGTNSSEICVGCGLRVANLLMEVVQSYVKEYSASKMKVRDLAEKLERAVEMVEAQPESCHCGECRRELLALLREG